MTSTTSIATRVTPGPFHHEQHRVLSIRASTMIIRWTDGRTRWWLVPRRQKNGKHTTYLGFGLQGTVPVAMSKGIHDRFIIVGRSVEELPAKLWRSKHVLPSLRVLIDVFPQQGERIGLGVPQPTTYTTRVNISSTQEIRNRREKKKERRKEKKMARSGNGDLPTKHEPGWK